jgi:hypothetical protein
MNGLRIWHSTDLPPAWRFSRIYMRHRSRAESQSSVPLFDWHDRPFVPTCPRIKHRAQRQARLARQGHRRRRLGLAGASTMLSCPRSEAAIAADRAESGSPIVRGGKGAAATHIRSTTRAVGPSFPVRRLEGVGRPGRAGPIFDGGVLQPCVGTVTRPSRLVGGQRPPVQCPLGRRWFQARSSTPSGITPVLTYLHSATASLRASATTRIRRSRPLL